MGDNIYPVWQPASGPAGSVQVAVDLGWVSPAGGGRLPGTRVTLTLAGPEVRDEGGGQPGVAQLRDKAAAAWAENPASALLTAALDRADTARRELSAADRELQRLRLDLAEALDAPAAPGQAVRVAEAQSAIAAAERHIAALRAGHEALASKADAARLLASSAFEGVVRISALRVREELLAKMDAAWARLIKAGGGLFAELARLAVGVQYSFLPGDMQTADARDLLGAPARQPEAAPPAAGPLPLGTPHLRHERGREPTQPPPVAPSGRPPIALMTHHTGLPGLPTMRSEGAVARQRRPTAGIAVRRPPS